MTLLRGLLPLLASLPIPGEAGRRLTTEFKAKYADWPINSLSAFVRSVYAE